MPSQSQASTLVNRGGRAATGAPASGAMARRRASKHTFAVPEPICVAQI